MTTRARPLLVALLLVTGCRDPGPTLPPEVTTAPPVTPPPAPAPWLADVPLGPAPAVPYVVVDTLVRPDGSRLDVRRPGLPRQTPPVLAFTLLRDRSLLVQDSDNFEGYTGLRHVVDGWTAASWSTTGFVTGPRGTAAFGEATTSEASDHGPVAVHLLRGSEHLVQEVPDHPSVVAIVEGRVVFRQIFSRTPSFVTDLVGPPVPWHGRVPTQPRVPRGAVPPGSVVLQAVREPRGALLLLVGRRDGSGTTALVRRLPDGSLEVAAPPLPRVLNSGSSPAYVLDARG